MGRHVVLVLVALPVLAGCAGQSPSERFGLATQPVYIVHRPAKPFKVDHTGYAAGRVALAPGIHELQAAESARLEQRLDLADPIAYGKERVAMMLRRDLAATNVQVVAEPRNDGLDKFKEKYPSGVLFEIHTEYWGIDNYSTTKYLAKAWVVSLDNPRKRWAVVCPWVQLDLAVKKAAPTSAPTSPFPTNQRGSSAITSADWAEFKKQLEVGEGAALKANLRKSAETCADYIARRVLGTGPAGNQPNIQDDIQ